MSALHELPAVTLPELDASAALQTRFDRKYVIPLDDLDAILTGIRGLRVLDVDGNRFSRYESTYLDTIELDSWTAAAHCRRRRWKVRTRRYADTGESWLEVKTRGHRGLTVKQRLRYDGDEQIDSNGPAAHWLRERLAAAHVRDVHPADLVATLQVSYVRSTLLLEGTSRATIDRQLRWASGHGSAEVSDVLVVETKAGTHRPGALDRRLWTLGHRPVRISKYGIGLALTTPDLHVNRWHRVTSRHLAGHLTLNDAFLR